MASFQERMIRAAKLDRHIYEEVEADPSAMKQAMGVVVLSSLAAGIGTIGEAGAGGIVVGTIGALIGWYLWAFLTYLIGTKLLPQPSTQADLGQLLRTIGFSSAPGILRIFGLIPGIGRIVFVLAGLWMLLAMVSAVRQALDYTSTWRAVGVCVISWVIQTVVVVLLLMVLFSATGGVPPLGP